MKNNGRFILRKEEWGTLVQDSLNDRIWALKNEELLPIMKKELPYKYDKMFIDEEILKKDIRLSSPISISWEITSNCNSKCVFCCNSSGEKGEDVPFKDIEKIAKVLCEWECLRIIIGGGEPLIRNDIIDILKLFESAVVKPAIATNGILLNDKLLRQIAKSCITLQISLDTLDKEKYIELRGIDALELVKRNIIFAKKYMRNIRIVTVLNEKNKNELEEIAEFLNGAGIEQWFVFKMLPSGRGKEAIKKLGVTDDTEIKKRLQSINSKYSNLSVWYWGTEKSDGVAVYVTSTGKLEIVDYISNKRTEFFHEEFNIEKIKMAWNDIDSNTQKATVINFTSQNKIFK